MDKTKALLICLLLIPAMAIAHGGRADAPGYQNSNISQHQHARGPTQSANTNSVKPKTATAQLACTTKTSANSDAESNMILRIQYALNQLGYAVGKPDGILNEKTAEAIQLFQAENEMVVDGQPSDLLLGALLRRLRE